MVLPVAVSQVQAMAFAGMPTVRVVVAIAQEAAEDAMLGVEDREVLVGHDLTICRPY